MADEIRNIVALTGPPKSGKTTVLNFFDDLGASTVDATDGSPEPNIEAESRTVVVGPVYSADLIDRLRDEYAPTIVISVQANENERLERYIDQNLPQHRDNESVSTETVNRLRDEFYDREHVEKPYPDHDLIIDNPNTLHAHDLFDRCKNMARVLGVDC